MLDEGNYMGALEDFKRIHYFSDAEDKAIQIQEILSRNEIEAVLFDNVCDCIECIRRWSEFTQLSGQLMMKREKPKNTADKIAHFGAVLQ